MVIKLKFPRNKKAWVKIVEAFTAVLLIASVLLIVINQGNIGKEDVSSQIYDVEVAMLREIQLDDNLRTEILDTTSSAEVSEEIAPLTWNRIQDRIPDYLICKAKICDIGEDCELSELPNQNIYAQTVAITAILEVYDPKQLKLFCWLK